METITRKITMESIAPKSIIREVNKPTLSQIRFHRQYGRRSLYNEMRELEKQFSWCVKKDEPARWFHLQDELGEIYRRVMKYYADLSIGSKMELVERLVDVVVTDFEERSCPQDTELRNEKPQLAYHRTVPCNMYFVTGNYSSLFIISNNNS